MQGNPETPSQEKASPSHPRLDALTQRANAIGQRIKQSPLVDGLRLRAGRALYGTENGKRDGEIISSGSLGEEIHTRETNLRHLQAGLDLLGQVELFSTPQADYILRGRIRNPNAPDGTEDKSVKYLLPNQRSGDVRTVVVKLEQNEGGKTIKIVLPKPNRPHEGYIFSINDTGDISLDYVNTESRTKGNVSPFADMSWEDVSSAELTDSTLIKVDDKHYRNESSKVTHLLEKTFSNTPESTKPEVKRFYGEVKEIAEASIVREHLLGLQKADTEEHDSLIALHGEALNKQIDGSMALIEGNSVRIRMTRNETDVYVLEISRTDEPKLVRVAPNNNSVSRLTAQDIMDTGVKIPLSYFDRQKIADHLRGIVGRAFKDKWQSKDSRTGQGDTFPYGDSHNRLSIAYKILRESDLVGLLERSARGIRNDYGLDELGPDNPIVQPFKNGIIMNAPLLGSDNRLRGNIFLIIDRTLGVYYGVIPTINRNFRQRQSIIWQNVGTGDVFCNSLPSDGRKEDLNQYLDKHHRQIFGDMRDVINVSNNTRLASILEDVISGIDGPLGSVLTQMIRRYPQSREYLNDYYTLKARRGEKRIEGVREGLTEVAFRIEKSKMGFQEDPLIEKIEDNQHVATRRLHFELPAYEGKRGERLTYTITTTTEPGQQPEIVHTIRIGIRTFQLLGSHALETEPGHRKPYEISDNALEMNTLDAILLACRRAIEAEQAKLRGVPNSENRIRELDVLVQTISYHSSGNNSRHTGWLNSK